ncbi:MAG: DUF554 domain-containing protein [Treponema sp.]|nr:DUF554 domain-containing protein [Treponema sp.]
MLGTIVNAVTIIVFSLIGTFLVKQIPDRFEEILKKASGLAVLFIGIRGAFDNENVLLLVLSLVIGALIGEIIDIDKWMNKLGLWAEKKLKMDSANVPEKKRVFSKGFISASILFCTGSMAIIGAMQGGLSGNHEVLYAKSVLDGTISIIFSASMGIGVAFSAVCVFIYQGGIALASMLIRDFLTQDMIREMSAVGSLLVAAIGFNFLSTKEIKIANLIPAIFIPCAYFSITGLFG